MSLSMSKYQWSNHTNEPLLNPDLWEKIVNELNVIDSIHFSMVCKDSYKRIKPNDVIFTCLHKLSETLQDDDDYDYEHRCGDKRCLYKTIIKRMVGPNILFNYDKRYVLRYGKIESVKRDLITVVTKNRNKTYFEELNVFAFRLSNDLSYFYREDRGSREWYHKTNDMDTPDALHLFFVTYWKESEFLSDVVR